MGALKKIRAKLISSIDKKIGTYLRKRYASFSLKKNYIVQHSDVQTLGGKVAIVTGGSGLIGRSCSVILASQGAIVYVAGTRNETIEPVVKEIIGLGFKAHALVLNVMDAVDIESKFAIVAKNNNGHIDILVNSAGGSARGKKNNIVDQDVDIIDWMINLNLRGSILCAKYAAKYMINNHWGRIIDIASTNGVQGNSGYSEYAASKGGTIAFSKSFAKEVAEFGITVNTVSPGVVFHGELSPERVNSLSNSNYVHRPGYAEDIAYAVSYFCSEQAAFVIGQNLIVDGGRSLGLKGAD